MLRSALSLSLVTGKPFRMENIRAKREKSGLLRQHLTAVLAASEVGSAQVEGATLGSKTLSFTLGPVRPVRYRFAVGTAGSATLVFQTILPALMTACGRSEVTIEGGTHNMQAPPLDFLQKAFLPVIHRLGPRIEIRLEKYGFYPAGGGRLTATVEPCERLSSICLLERGEIDRRAAVAIVANLPRSIAQREMDTIAKLLNWDAGLIEVVETRDSAGPGNIVLIELAGRNVTEIFCGFGSWCKRRDRGIGSRRCGSLLSCVGCSRGRAPHRSASASIRSLWWRRVHGRKTESPCQDEHGDYPLLSARKFRDRAGGPVGKGSNRIAGLKAACSPEGAALGVTG